MSACDGNGRSPWDKLLWDEWDDLLPHIEDSLRNGDFCMFSPTPTETIKQACRLAYQERDKQAFGDAASHLLIRGYRPVLGVRGGLSFQWVGVTREGDEHWQAVREQFARIVWRKEESHASK